MKTINKLRKRRAISPVIATVILVAITITVAVAVAYWMSGIAGQYTKFEKIEIQSGYAQKSENIIVPGTPGVGDTKGWQITLQLQNTGSGEATLSDCFINDIPLKEYGDNIIWSYEDAPDSEAPMPPEGLTMVSGGKQTLFIYISQTEITSVTGAGTELDPFVYTWEESTVTFTSGTTINVKIHSASGMDYIRLVQLP